MALNGISKSWVDSSTMVSYTSLWVLFGAIKRPNRWIEFYQSFDTMWRTPKLLDRFNFEPKGENNERIRSWGMLLGL